MGIIITNKFYTDYGMEYAINRLKTEFAILGRNVSVSNDIYCGYNRSGYSTSTDADFVIFWDKDISLAKSIEASGKPIFPSVYSLEVCDDKEKTYSAVASYGIPLVDTLVYPLTYDVNNEIDRRFLLKVESEFGYPTVIKQNVGSQGRQVYIANDREELFEIADRLKHIPHQYQRFMGEYGSDIRLYVVGGRVVASVKRTNTTGFRSNVACGGTMQIFDADKEFQDLAVKIASALKMDFGSVDFVCSEKPVFLEANSNAYFKGIEQLGISVADKIAKYILEKANVRP